MRAFESWMAEQTIKMTHGSMYPVWMDRALYDIRRMPASGWIGMSVANDGDADDKKPMTDVKHPPVDQHGHRKDAGKPCPGCGSTSCSGCKG